MRDFLKRNWFYTWITILFGLPVFFLLDQNLGKGITILVLLILWFITGVWSRNFIRTTLLFIFFVLPFNLSIQLPESVQILNTNITISFPYVSGVLVNYLVPTLHILDVFILLLLIVLFYERKDIFLSVLRNKYLLVLLGLLVIQNIYVQEILVAFNSVRIYLYIFAALGAKEYLHETKDIQKVLRKSYSNIFILASVLIQGSIGILQFWKGTSVGLFFLGESHIVNGMSGSSFIDINGASFLRAYGTFPHPNLLAGWLILMFFLTWCIYSNSRSKLFPVANGVLILLLSIFTFSRLSLLILLILTIVWLITAIRNKDTLFSLSTLIWVRYLNLFTNEDSSFGDRLELIKANWNMFKQYTLTGTGLGNSLKYYGNNMPYTANGKLLLQPVHNIFLLSFVELGILAGAYFWFLIYIFFLRDIKWNIKKVFILLAIFLIGMFDHYFFTLPQGITSFYLFLVLLVC